MHKRMCCLSAALAVVTCIVFQSTVLGDDDSGFVPLFDSKSLKNWEQKGGKAKYEVKDGVILGTTVKGQPNSFLCTKKNYGDFVLVLEFWADTGLNSGIQIRSHAYDEETTITVKSSSGKVKEKKMPRGRVHGYQVEIDPSDRAWTGGIYDEGRRGWLNDLKKNEAARKAYKPDTWNKFRVVARGASIKTWLNGIPAADLTDDMTPSGFIALQVHGTKSDKPLHVRWRNIKIKELE